MTLEHRSILENAETIEAEFKQQPQALSYLHSIYLAAVCFFFCTHTIPFSPPTAGLITDLFIARCKFKGENPKNRLPELTKVLENYKIEAVKALFA
jgi:hypothetical protein